MQQFLQFQQTFFHWRDISGYKCHEMLTGNADGVEQLYSSKLGLIYQLKDT